MPDRDPPSDSARPRSSQPDTLAQDICVVGIGASAGGLEACRRLLAALPAAPGMVFILVQHLDPGHASMLVELLAGATPMKVCEAADGMAVAVDHVYIIPPGAYLALARGRLQLSTPLARHGARLPFDFLLNSLAKAVGQRAVCVVLSGTGADGTLGLAAIKQAGGLVIAQDPDEAGFDGMPRSAIATGVVDLVLPVAQIAAALARRLPRPAPQSGLHDIILFLKSSARHDFTLYKPGTLERRIERRMVMAGLAVADTGGYLALLRADAAEADALAADLLIHVTSFFRDGQILEQVAATEMAGLAAAAAGQPIRLWVVGCSTGEETYSLAILFSEALRAAGSDSKLQVFASDADPQAVATAREGLYPAGIEGAVSAARLAQFFVREAQGYRVAPALRGCIVFAVQDVLADAPFARLSMISCRNLMIYLQPEAQARVIDVFDFALREGGVLLLGADETIGAPDGRFVVMSKLSRTYRKAGRSVALPRSAPGLANFLSVADAGRLLRTEPVARAPDVAEIYRLLVLERYAPPAVLVNRQLECLYTSGMIGAFLHIAPGYPTHDLLSLLAPHLRARVRAGVAEVAETQAPARLAGGHITRNGEHFAFSIEIQPVSGDAEKFMLFFLTQPAPARAEVQRGGAKASGRALVLERELAAVRADLQLTIRSLEISGEQQQALNEEALSVNEEYQATNEELLTSKEELQSLNEELTALNSQLQETLERKRGTLSDLQNVLYSSDVATLFLDAGLQIRFFTPAATALFAIMPADVGRKLADFRPRAADPALFSDAALVLADSQPREAEVLAETGAWFQRRVQPYRTLQGATAGVVITFADITERRATRAVLEAAQRAAEQANLAKSQFLAAASHDLRQPLQVMRLISALLAKAEQAPAGVELVVRLDQAIGSMATMLNALLDINQIDAGIVQPARSVFPVQALLDTIEREFAYLAAAQGLALRLVPCSLSIDSDPRLLEQMLRNLVANALKYTRRGGVLVGCRRQGEALRIEVWDSGIGIPEPQWQEIFEEYRQIGNSARARSRGLGLGLSIVKRLGVLLGHAVKVRSWMGRGSVFAIEVKRAAAVAAPAPTLPVPAPVAVRAEGTILLVEDDQAILQLLEGFLAGEGLHVLAAADGPAALRLAAGPVPPDLVLTDYNLPAEMNGVALILAVRDLCRRDVPGIVITGDIASATLRDIAGHGCVPLNKPMKLAELMSAIQALLVPPAAALPGTVLVIDDDPAVRVAMQSVFAAEGYEVRCFADCEAFLQAEPRDAQACLLLDEHLPGMSGFALLEVLAASARHLPAIMITGQGDVRMAVRAMRAGVSDFIEKPASAAQLRSCVARALKLGHDAALSEAETAAAVAKMAQLTTRQLEVMQRVLAGELSKNIAADLRISQRTVETHRAAVMAKTGARSIPELARLAIKAGNLSVR